MKTFKDREGREWQVDVNVNTIKRVKSLLGVDLLKLTGPELAEELVGDPVTLCNVVYVICKLQADARNITDEDFGQAMAGDPIDHATTALLEEFVDFFPSRKREPLAKALAKLREVEAAQIAIASKMINDPAITEAITKAMASIGGRSFGVSPQSPDATPAP